MRDVVAAGDEDRLVVPEEWREVMHPRRGAVLGEVSIPERTGSRAALETLHGAKVLADAAVSIEHPQTLPRVAEALRRELAGESSPTGVAALSVLASPKQGADLPAHVEAWIAAYGLPFAAATTVEAAVLIAGRPVYNDDRVCVYDWKGNRVPESRGGLLRLMRGYLAAADEDTYAEAVRLLAGYREELSQRVAVSYLMPTESKWLSEVCLRMGKARMAGYVWRPWVALLQCSITRPEEIEALRKRAAFQSDVADLGIVATAAVNLGAPATALFPYVLDSPSADMGVRRMMLGVLARMPSDEAFEVLATRLTAKHVQPAVVEASRRFPRRATRLLSAQACGEGENALAARSLLSAHLVQHAELVAEVRTELAEDELRLVEQLCARFTQRPTASADELPVLLTSPPWTRKRPRSNTPTAVFEALQAPDIKRVAWRSGEREAFKRAGRLTGHSAWQTLLAEIEEKGTSGSSFRDRQALLYAPEELARRALPHLRTQFTGIDQVHAWGGILARFGDDAIDPILRGAEGGNLTNRGALLQPVLDLRVARLAADWLLRLKGIRPQAMAWLTRYREEAAILLIPDALGSDKALRLAAAGALRHLASSAELDVAGIAERTYGAEAATAVKTILAVDPLELLPARMPKLPAWLLDTHLPQILLRGRERALPEESVQHVLSMLAISKPGEPYAGLETVKELADGPSLAAFGRALLAAWRAADYPSKESWILTAQGTLGDEETVRRLVPLLVAWPLQHAHHRAVAGLDVMVELGTDETLFRLYRIGRTVPRKSLKEQAQKRIERLAVERGLTLDQFIDRLIPDFGLDAQSGVWLDYGPRRFRATFDEQLQPVLTDESGAQLPGPLPDPDAADDAELAEAAREQLAGLTEDVQAVVAHVLQRMETTVSVGGSWTTEEFRRLLHGHPVAWRLARGVVWLSEADGVTTAFRVAEDGGFADVDDKVFALPEQAAVRLAHPLRLGRDLAVWAELFADYEILQPFPQLGRPVRTLTERERAGAPFTRFEGSSAQLTEVFALLERGWQSTRPDGTYGHDYLTRATHDGRWLFLVLKPGITFGYDLSDESRQKLGPVFLDDSPSPPEQSPKESSSLHDLDPITVSELLGDLSRLTTK